MMLFDPSDLPPETDRATQLFPAERQFERWLLDHGMWFWRQFGIEKPRRNAMGHTPDLLSKVVGTKLPFNIEVEHNAINFRAHGHDPYNIHLILSAVAPIQCFTIRQLPVVSLYRLCPDGVYRYSLEDDIGAVFHDRMRHLEALWFSDGDPED